jgi:hypothetical protein
MCIGSGPKLPDPPKAAPAPPAAPKQLPMEAPTQAPVQVAQGEADAGKLKKKKSKRSQLQQASKGASSLRIPLNTGTKKPSGGLNIPK